MPASSTNPRRKSARTLTATLVALLLALALPAAGCSGTRPGETVAGPDPTSSASPIAGGVLRASAIDPGAAIEPTTNANVSAGIITSPVLEPLVRIRSDNTPFGVLATSWVPSRDGLTWTFQLRHPVLFNNGRPLTSADVAHTYDNILAPDSTSPSKGALTVLRTVKAHGPFAVDFVLNKPFSDFPLLLSQVSILPADYKVGSWQHTFVGTGPFVVTSFRPGEGVTYKKNPTYWNAANIYLDGVEITFYRDQQSRVLALQSGEIDGLFGPETISASLLSALNESDFTTVRERAGGFEALVFRVDQPPFNDVKVRQAVAWALDRQALIDTVYNGHADLANDTIYSARYSITPEGLEQRSADPAKVNELLGDTKVSFTLTTSNELEAYATAIQQQLNANGHFDVKLNILSADAYYADGKNSPWLTAPATLTLWGERPSPTQFNDYIYRRNSPWNASRYSNPKLEALFDAYDATTDTAKRQKIVNQIGAIEWTDVPVVITAYPNVPQITSKKLHLGRGAVYTQIGSVFTDAWIEH